VRASQPTLELITGYYASLDAGRLDETDRWFTPDATMQIAHLPRIEGRDAIENVVRTGMANPRVERIVHEVRNAWDVEDDTVIFEVVAHYTLADGREVDVPGVVIAEVADGRFMSQRIAADLSPIYGGS